MKKLRHKEVAQDHIAHKGRVWDWNSDSLAPESRLLTALLLFLESIYKVGPFGSGYENK